MTARTLLPRLGLCMAALCTSVAAVAAAGYPQRAVTIVVPFPAGGPTDLLARVVGNQLSARMGQPVVIENRGGGNTVVAASAVARAKPDGYTLLLAVDNTLVMNPSLYTDLPYDPVKDFEPVSKVAVSPLIIVTAADHLNSFDAITQAAKASAKPISYGFGTISTQLGGELLKRSLGLEMLGVPYKGSAGTVQGILSGDVDFVIDGVTAALPHIKAGKLKALAVLGKDEAPGLPALPRVADQPGLQGFDVSVWMAMVAPRGTPSDVIQYLNTALAETLALPDVAASLRASGLIPEASSPQALRDFMAAEAARWAPVIQAAGMRIQ